MVVIHAAGCVGKRLPVGNNVYVALGRFSYNRRVHIRRQLEMGFPSAPTDRDLRSRLVVAAFVDDQDFLALLR